MTTTRSRQRATFLLEMALDQERMKQRIAVALAAERDRRHLTQMQMAAAVGTSYRQYQRWETGESMPRWRALEDMADRLALDVGQLLAETDGDQPGPPAARPVVADLGEIGARYARLEERMARIEGAVDELRVSLASDLHAQSVLLDALAEGVADLRRTVRPASRGRA